MNERYPTSARKRSGITSIAIKRGERNRPSLPYGERQWMSNENCNGEFIMGYSRKSGRARQLQDFLLVHEIRFSLVGAMFCHRHFRGRLLNDPRSQPHANPPAAHSSPPTFWMRWLHRIRLFFYLSHTFHSPASRLLYNSSLLTVSFGSASSVFMSLV
jgi:hypothetical protein